MLRYVPEEIDAAIMAFNASFEFHIPFSLGPFHAIFEKGPEWILSA